MNCNLVNRLEILMFFVPVQFGAYKKNPAEHEETQAPF